VVRALQPTALALLLFASAAAGQNQGSVGVASSDYPFLIQGKTVPGNGTVLEMEAVTSSYTPVRVNLSDGARYVLGSGSQARFASDRIRLDGVSLEVVSSGPEPQRIEAAGIALITTAPLTRAAVYTDQRDRVSVWVESGEMTALGPLGKELRKIGPEQALTFSDTDSELGITLQEKRAPLEIARIQMRQVEYLAAVERESPAFRERRREIAVMLVEASGGLLLSGSFRDDGTSNLVIPTDVPSVNTGVLLQATVEAAKHLNQARIAEAGCGRPPCKSEDPPAARNSFDGWRGGLPEPYPSCTLCRVSVSDEAP